MVISSSVLCKEASSTVAARYVKRHEQVGLYIICSPSNLRFMQLMEGYIKDEACKTIWPESDKMLHAYYQN